MKMNEFPTFASKVIVIALNYWKNNNIAQRLPLTLLWYIMHLDWPKVDLYCLESKEHDMV